MIRVHPAEWKSEYADRLPPSNAKHASKVSRWDEMSVVSNRVEYDASFDQICQKIAKYATIGRSMRPCSWMADPQRENAVTVTISANDEKE